MKDLSPTEFVKEYGIKSMMAYLTSQKLKLISVLDWGCWKCIDSSFINNLSVHLQATYKGCEKGLNLDWKVGM